MSSKNMTNEEFWKLQQTHEKELEAISEILSQNKDGSSIRALYLMCNRIDRDFQLPGKPDCEYTELVREAACSLAGALELYASEMGTDLKHDLEALVITETVKTEFVSSTSNNQKLKAQLAKKEKEN